MDNMLTEKIQINVNIAFSPCCSMLFGFVLFVNYELFIAKCSIGNNRCTVNISTVLYLKGKYVWPKIIHQTSV